MSTCRSAGRFSDRHRDGCRGPGFDSTLPAPGDTLGDPPDLTGPEALTRFHDMNPYLTIESLANTGPRLAARLVVVSTRTMASRLAWELRYSFPCWDTGLGAKEPTESRDTTFAYVDARSGILIFGRDSERQGGTSPEVPVARVSAGLGKPRSSRQEQRGGVPTQGRSRALPTRANPRRSPRVGRRPTGRARTTARRAAASRDPAGRPFR